MKSSSDVVTALRKFLATIVDARQLVVSSMDGSELISVSSSASLTDEGPVLNGLVPSFLVSCDQTKRFDLGALQHAITWVGGRIVLQMLVGSVVVSLLLEETANLGLIGEHVDVLSTLLQPLHQT